MSISADLAALQALHATISGVSSAPATPPDSAESARLPLVLLRPGAGSVSREARGVSGASRTYEGVCLVTALSAGSVAQGIGAVRSAMDAFTAFYRAHIEAGTDLSSGNAVVGYRDNGGEDQIVEYRGRQWEGFSFSVEVWEA